MANQLSLLIESPQAIAQTTVYSLPPRLVAIFSDVALEVSNTTDFTVKATIAAATTANVAAAYVRSTTAAANISLKAY